MIEGFEIGQIPHVTILNSRIRQAIGDDPEKQRVQEYYLEQLPYSLVASATALLNLTKAQNETPKLIPAFPREGSAIGVILLPEQFRNLMGFAIDNYFDSARRAQNATGIYISKVLRISVPASMADLIKDIESGKVTLPDDIKMIVLKYWKIDGIKVKHYRDLAQHHVVVSSDARLTLLPDGRELIHMTLPNNPSEKNPARLKYDNPTVDAFRYIFNSYMRLYEYIYTITYILLSYTLTPEHEVLSIMFKSPVTLGSKRPEGHPLPDINKVVELIKKHQTDIRSNISGK
jgi:hypothetical protein